MPGQAWILDHFSKFSNRTAVISDNRAYTYGELSKAIEDYLAFIEARRIEPGEVVAIHSDYTFDAIALFFALSRNKNIVVPIVSETPEEVEKRLASSGTDWIMQRRDGGFELRKRDADSRDISYIENLKNRGHSGLILFSSGSTGEPKAMIHDLDNLIDSYRGKTPKALNTLVFLTFDHIGGIDTMMRAFAIGGTMTIPTSRQPEAVCEEIEKHGVNVLPASPTFINLLLMSGLHRKYDLSSLEIIAFGAEPMPQPLLKRVRENFPHVRLQQKFGTSETGAIKIRSDEAGSLLFKIDDPNVEYKIVDGELWLKSKTQVLGYLNASMQNFTEDGWFRTGDLVERMEDGRLKIIGRSTEVINVGGEKVFPSEVEAVLLEMDEVADAMVYGEENPITGQGVTVDVVPTGGQDKREMKKLIRKFCKERLDGYKIPSKVNIVDKTNFGDRFKKIRRK
ncbi:class I adenylate-forming enzyme family protein [Hydrogenimonas cancrithermarum]|uniref:AMP-dependent synthetase n=1 Tax=Hydrogenimonas cancrithermarum TaxID=2993563 RepID=A0ABM8FNW5_9BACT|nr:fatty acid--CoA ligase family protein [Hydrogenimonas cancrithermarum]BDY13566.1 AMP-dependent synthetase [Hydrogenimonas cancrithermarum]